MMNKLLVANRGEIAVRILQAGRELDLHTVALCTPDDDTHCTLGHPDEILRLPSPSAYLDIDLLLQLCRDHAIDTIHPGYGFLSESADFARRMHEYGVTVIGPGWSILSRTGDKLQAKQLAAACGVPVLESRACSSPAEISAFIAQVGYPVMIKAVDGGGGRGIRLVRAQQAPELESLVARARAESPSGTVFVEKAAVDGFHHVEVQVVGDGRGAVRHLWARDCSLQRRFQKIVEVAPGMLDRTVLREVVRAALRIAARIHYRSLGTFEFLVSEQAGARGEFYFLEINPRLQVEHTITEQLAGVDLVQTQLRLARGESLGSVGVGVEETDAEAAPPRHTHSIQLRLCAEDPRAHFALSIGKVTDFFVPTGAGVRVDTHLAPPVVVGSHFDNLLAKIIVTAGSWEAAVRRARRVLQETRIAGVKTNLDLLRGIVAHGDFLHGRWDTQWLERNLPAILRSGEAISATVATRAAARPAALLQSLQASSAASVLFRRGDAWAITLAPKDQPQRREEVQHHLRLARVLRNDFPGELVAEVEYTTPEAATTYRVQLASTNTAAAALVSSHRRGDVSNPRHVVLPLSGKLIEVLVRPGEDVATDQVVAFVKQMKMELEVRSPRAGRVKWAYELEEGEEEDVAEGVLLAELEEPVSETGKL